ncbi:hypothetical protein GOBAR_DD29010 [Gossypium barbadense]|nr:hypothetical protein GOBAR_DD29010 [Gossypium barbadense]
MDNIGVSNDDTISGFSLRRPSRAERAIDDPIREMEGMLVDEYGSNATFQLPGLLSSNVFEDEEEDDLSISPGREAADASPLEAAPALGELETCTVTPSDRPHRILEDVDGELEMEDVSGHLKNDRPFTNDALQMDWQQQGIMEPASNSSNEFPPLPEAIQSSPQLAYQPPVPHEFRGTPNGNQIVQMAGNTPHGGHIDASVKSELFPQQSPCFVPGVCNSREPSGYVSSRQLDYGHNEMYLNAQSSQPSQQFQPGNAAFVQRPLAPSLPQTSSSHFSFTKPAMPPHPQHSYPQYDGWRPFVADEQWRMPAGEYNTDNQHGGWISGRNPSPCGPLFVREAGYFRPPVERPSSNVGFPLASANNLPAGAPNSGVVMVFFHVDQTCLPLIVGGQLETGEIVSLVICGFAVD